MNTSISLLQAHDLGTADHIFRLAFGTFVGLPEPTEFYKDIAYFSHRWKINPNRAFAAEVDGKLVGSNFVTLGMSRLVAGINTSRESAYFRMLACGFRSDIIGVAMHKPNDPGYNRQDVFSIDDWR